jgi:CheY-like chemotaxis protein
VEILVVEDEAAIADFVARGLESEGHEVLTAADGVGGERLALSEGVDLVILDRMLPGKDGMEVLAALRRAKPALPVILLTAKGEVADRVEGLDAGAGPTTWPSRSPSRSWRRGCGRTCAGRRARGRRRWRRRGSDSTWSRGGSSATGARSACPSARPNCSPT